jgi:hypothetical protein
MESRLLATKSIMTKSDALVEVDRRERITKAVFSTLGVVQVNRENKKVFSEFKKEFDDARSANTAVTRLLAREANSYDMYSLMGNESFLVSKSGVKELTMDLVEWLIRKKGKGTIYDFRDIPREEDMYLRSEVSLEETMRVRGVDLVPGFTGRVRSVVTTKSKVGLFKVPREMEDWARLVVSELKELRLSGANNAAGVAQVAMKDLLWVKDDAPLLYKIQRDLKQYASKSVLIVTTDADMCQQIASNVGCYVTMVKPSDLLLEFRKEFEMEELAEYVRSQLDRWNKTISRRVSIVELSYIDTGSTGWAASGIEIPDTTRGNALWKSEVRSVRFEPRGEEVKLTLVGNAKCIQFTTFQRNDHYPLKYGEEIGEEPGVDIKQRFGEPLARKGKRSSYVMSTPAVMKDKLKSWWRKPSE